MIKLDEKFTLTTDTNNWVLRFEEVNEVEDPKTHEIKKVTSNWESYHGELKFALKKYCDSVLKVSVSVAELMVKMKELENKIDNLKIKK